MNEELIARLASAVWGQSNWSTVQLGRLKMFAEMVKEHANDPQELARLMEQSARLAQDKKQKEIEETIKNFMTKHQDEYGKVELLKRVLRRIRRGQ
mgnify:CR=1 FL=1